MAPRPEPTPEITRARHYAARVRILLAAFGAGLLWVDPSVSAAPVPAAIGFGVIALTGVAELIVRGDARSPPRRRSHASRSSASSAGAAAGSTW